MTIDPQRVDAYAQRVLETGVAPALAVCVSDADGPLLERTYGGAAAGCLWQIGSISKSFTAVLAVQLAEAGRLDLHAPVTEYLPWFAVGGGHAPITLHHLLTHTSGMIIGAEVSTASTFDVIAVADTDANPPGEHFWYSNVGYRTVGLVLEHVTETPYPQLLQERILDPLGMSGSSPVIVQAMRSRMPQGHVAFYDDRPWRPEHGLAPATWIEAAEADGSICSPVAELAAWGRALLTADQRVLSARGHELLTAPHAVDDQGDEPGRYGYGLNVTDRGVEHSGGMVGYVAQLFVDRELGIAIAACSNGPRGAHALATGVRELARGEDAPDPTPELIAAVADDGSCPAEWQPFLGHYRSHNPWLSNVRIVARDGSLVAETFEEEPYPLTPVGAAEFRMGKQPWSPERLRFDTVIDGRAQRAMLSGGPLYRTFTP